MAQCDDEKKTENTKTKVENTEDSKGDASTAEKKQDKRGIYDFGDYGGGGDSHEWSGHHHHQPIHEEKTLTVVKKVPVPYPVVKHVKVEHVKHIPVPVKVHVSIEKN